MKFHKIINFLIILTFLINSAYSIGVFDESGDFVYFMNNKDPEINISLKSTAEPIIIDDAYLYLDEQKFIKDINEEILPTQERKFTFKLSDFNLNTSIWDKNVFFQLLVKSKVGTTIKPKGDPTYFEIKLDETKPKIIIPTPDQNIELDNSLNRIEFTFDEQIKNYKIILNGKIFKDYKNPSLFKRDFEKTIKLEIPFETFQEGVNTLKVEFEDLAGNKNEEIYQISFRGDDLTMKLLTNADDNSIKYFYDKNYLQFFNKTIYTSEEKFDLQVRTTKKSKCYFSDNMIFYDTFNNVLSKEEFSSSDNLLHTIKVDTKETDKIWVACQNIAFIDDIVYLNDVMGFKNSLVGVKQYLGEKLQINDLFPEELVTSIPFNIDVSTNERAVCKFDFNGISDQLLESKDNRAHTKKEIDSPDGKKDLTVKCFDVINSKATKTNPLTIDRNSGVKIVNYEPKYTNRATIDMKITLSEDAICRHSLKQVKTSEFSTLEDIPGTGLSRSFKISGLITGNNYIYVYCKKLNNINNEIIKVIYDSVGPTIQNLTFVNKGIESEYVGSTSEISFRFDVNTLIPIKQYHVEVTGLNSTFKTEVLSNDATIFGDFNDSNKLRIKAENEISMNSTFIQKTVKFDLEPPITQIIKQGNNIQLNCNDLESGCYKITYGFSETGENCETNLNYNVGDSIPTQGFKYICASSQDKVGNSDFKQEAIVQKFNFNETANIEDIENTNNNSNQNGSIPEPEIPIFEPFIPTGLTNDSGSGALVVLGMILILVGAGGGGYYAYRKGYLDEQLVKLGIVKEPKRANSNEETRTSDINYDFDNTGSAKIGSTKRKNPKLKNLDKFIDETLDKRRKIFTEFGKSSKGQVDGYDDTLTKKSDSFGDFYKSSDKRQQELNKKDKNTVIEEAEEFEKYHKNKSKKDNNKKE